MELLFNSNLPAPVWPMKLICHVLCFLDHFQSDSGVCLIAQKLLSNELSKVFNEPSLSSTIYSHLVLLSSGIAFSKIDYLPYQLLLIHLIVKQFCL